MIPCAQAIPTARSIVRGRNPYRARYRSLNHFLARANSLTTADMVNATGLNALRLTEKRHVGVKVKFVKVNVYRT